MCCWCPVVEVNFSRWLHYALLHARALTQVCFDPTGLPTELLTACRSVEEAQHLRKVSMKVANTSCRTYTCDQYHRKDIKHAQYSREDIKYA